MLEILITCKYCQYCSSVRSYLVSEMALEVTLGNIGENKGNTRFPIGQVSQVLHTSLHIALFAARARNIGAVCAFVVNVPSSFKGPVEQRAIYTKIRSRFNS